MLVKHYYFTTKNSVKSIHLQHNRMDQNPKSQRSKNAMLKEKAATSLCNSLYVNESNSFYSSNFITSLPASKNAPVP